MFPGYFDQATIEDMRTDWGIINSAMNRYIAVLDSMGFSVKYLPTPKTTEVRALTKEQMAQLDANVRADKDLDCQALYAILRDSGCRGLIEFDRVEPVHVSWDRAELELVSFKGGECVTRIIPMTDNVVNGLAWLREDVNDVRYYFRRITESQWRSFWNRVRLSPTNVPYDLRHTFCTRLLDSNVPPPTVMQIMGHSNLDQTLHYMHQRPSALNAARVALQNE